MRSRMFFPMLVPAFGALACTQDMKNPSAPSTPAPDSVIVSVMDSSQAIFQWGTPHKPSDSRVICQNQTENHDDHADTTYYGQLTENHLVDVIGREGGSDYACTVESKDLSGRLIFSKLSRFATMNMTPILPLQTPVVLAIQTYDGSGQTVHPSLDDCYYWSGHLCRLLVEPSPDGDNTVENPSFYVGDDFVHWFVPDGGVNPLVQRPIDGYNSDGEIMRDRIRGQEVMIVRTVAGGYNVLRAFTSRDLVRWDSSAVIYRVPNHKAVSPSITMAPDSSGVWRTIRWDVVVDKNGCAANTSHVVMSIQQSDSGFYLKAPWSDTVTTDLHQPGYVIWHTDIRYFPSHHEFFALFAAFPKSGRNGCGEDEEFAGRSQDGIHWITYRRVFAKHGVYDWAKQAVYRFGMALDENDMLNVLLNGFSIVQDQASVARGLPALAIRSEGPLAVNGAQEVWNTAYAPYGQYSALIEVLEQSGRNP